MFCKKFFSELGKSCCVYIDDIIIFGHNKEQHDKNFSTVMALLKQYGLKASPTKFKFCEKSVQFLGHIVSENEIKADPEKVRCIKEWPTPVYMKDLTRFIGFVNYYRKCVHNFSAIISPLEEASNKAKTMRKTKVNWTQKLQSSFVEIKNVLCSTPILHWPKKEDLFVLDTDASKYGIGGVLSQRDSQGIERVLYFASNRLSKAEQNYCATRKELLAVVRYIEFFYHYLIGKKFIVRTDHFSLKWLLSWKTPTTPQYFSWISKLQQFDFEVVYREGKNHVNADALSRIEYCKKCKTDHKPKVLQLKSEGELKVDEAAVVKQCLENNETPGLSSPQLVLKLWKMKERLILKEGKLYIKEDKKCRLVLSRSAMFVIIKQFHRSACHIGANNLFEIFSRNYFSIKLREICQAITSSCLLCLKRKAFHPNKAEPGNLRSSHNFQKVFMDVAGPFAESEGFKYVLVILDGYSNLVSITPIRNITGFEIAQTLLNRWVTFFGAPEVLHSDNAKYFSSPEVAKVCARFHIKQSFSSPYYPQGNGKVERMIYTIKDMLYAVTKKNHRSWSHVVCEVQLCLQDLVRSSIGLSPFEIVYGRNVRVGNEIDDSFVGLSECQVAEFMKRFTEISRDFERDSSKKIKEGDKVMVRILPKEKSILKLDTMVHLQLRKLKEKMMQLLLKINMDMKSPET